MNKRHPSEKGQILIIFFFALVALLGFAALAIDGGMIYADRRYDQAAADASSLAGAGAAASLLEKYGVTWNEFGCTAFHGMQAQKAAFVAAKNRGASNQFTTLDNNLSDKNGIKITCVNNKEAFDAHLDVRTQITSEVSTAFAQLLFTGKIKNTVDSIARIRPRTYLAYGYAIASLGSGCESKVGGTDLTGTSNININGGGVFSNSCLDANGSMQVKVTDGGINYITDYRQNGGPTVNPAPYKAPMAIPTLPEPQVECGTSAPVSHNGSGTINPGNYSVIRVPAAATLTMNPGLYCLTGDFVVNGTVTGEGVTIYMQKNGSDVTNVNVAGNATATLSAPTTTNQTAGSLVGLLFYMAPGNAGSISLAGTATSTFTGSVYGRDASIEVGGTTGVNPTYNTQLVGKYVKVNGTSAIDINFNNFEPWSDPPRLDQLE